MSLTIEDEATVAAIKRLAERTGRSAEDVVRHAVETEAANFPHLPPQAEADKPAGTVSPEVQARRMAAIREIQREFKLLPKSSLKADKAFFDSLNDDDR